MVTGSLSGVSDHGLYLCERNHPGRPVTNRVTVTVLSKLSIKSSQN